MARRRVGVFFPAVLCVAVWLTFSSLAFAQPSVATVPPTPQYADAAAAIKKLIEHELQDKKLPALSIALVDDQRVVWAAGFGFQDRAKKIAGHRRDGLPRRLRLEAVHRCRGHATRGGGQARPRRAGGEVCPRVQAGIQGRPEADHAANADGAPLRPHPRAAGRQLLRSHRADRSKRPLPASTAFRWFTIPVNGQSIPTPPSGWSATRFRRRRTSSSRSTCSAGCSTCSG